MLGTSNKLIFFDLDGTIIDGVEYSWLHMYEYFGIKPEIPRSYFKKFIHGGLSYDEWTTQCVDLLKAAGATKATLLDAFKELKLHQGAHEVLQELKSRGYNIFVISGSVDILLDAVDPHLPTYFTEIFINKLHFNRHGEITGVTPTPYDFEHKAQCIKNMARKYSAQLEDCVFIGDNDNDVHAAMVAGSSIAFNSKSEPLIEVATHHIEQKDLRAIIPLIG